MNEKINAHKIFDYLTLFNEIVVFMRNVQKICNQNAAYIDMGKILLNLPIPILTTKIDKLFFI